ncbi:hypothetical protein [Streptomyces sp. NPDC005322]|uniref:hypothetical protein n=1 Tax=unclassified Streptomyces TaxID=2593676 RepID=UPI0033B18169
MARSGGWTEQAQSRSYSARSSANSGRPARSNFVASETAAVVPLPSFHGAEGFDCGVLLSREAAVGLVHHGREACASARPVETIEAVRGLPVRHN